MFRGLQRFLATASEWHPRDFVIGMVGAELVTLCAAVSLGFGTFSAFTHLSASQGPVLAAAMVSAAYGVAAVIAGAALARWRASSAKPPAATPPAPEKLETLLRALAAAGGTEDQAALMAAMKVGRDLSPMELVATSLVSGFVAGRRARSWRKPCSGSALRSMRPGRACPGESGALREWERRDDGSPVRPVEGGAGAFARGRHPLSRGWACRPTRPVTRRAGCGRGAGGSVEAEVAGGELALLAALDVVAQLVALAQLGDAAALHVADVDEHVARAVCGLDEAVALG
jgi:hypothetical protein